MWQFEHPSYLWALLLVPLIGLLFRLKQQATQRFVDFLGGPERTKRLIPGFNIKKNKTQAILLMAAWVFGILALANLQAGLATQTIQRNGIDVMLCLDLSNSMLATDIAPSRLERAKQWIGQMLEAMPNNRVGLVVFAGHAYVSVPLTHDHAALKMNLADIHPEQMPTQGTSLQEALGMARERFNLQEARYKSIVLFSDGEDHNEDALDAVKECRESGILVNTVGIGSSEGSRIPDPVNGGVKQDRDGNDIISTLNENLLMNLAEEGKGTYVRMENNTPEGLTRLLNNTQQGAYDAVQTKEYKSYYSYFALLSLLCLLLEHYAGQSKTPSIKPQVYA